MSEALRRWREKLDHLQAEEAIASDAEQKFNIAERIKEIKAKIAELEAVSLRQSASTASASQDGNYLHDIFISYRRWDDEWIRWTKENFVRPLRSLLRPALGNVRIYVDEQVESGASWPLHLSRALACSKILVPVLSRDYFNSDWCRLELALMLNREQQTGFRCQANPYSLVLPIVIDDGVCFPPEIQAINSKPFHDFANPCMCTNSPKQEKFADEIKTWIPDIEMALTNAPPFDPSWGNVAHNQFQHLFKIKTQAQTTVPGLSLASNVSQDQ